MARFENEISPSDCLQHSSQTDHDDIYDATLKASLRENAGSLGKYHRVSIADLLFDDLCGTMRCYWKARGPFVVTVQCDAPLG